MRAGQLTALASAAALVALLAAVSFGAGEISADQVIAVLLDRITLTPPADPLHDALVWTLRLPRALLALLVGGSLACAGALTQALFRNNLADPSVLGVSAGAALAAVIGFLLGVDRVGLWVTPGLAILGALAILAVLYALTWTRANSMTLLLAGVALGALCAALTTFALAVATDRFDLAIKVVRWLMGSLEGRSWGHLLGALGPALIGLAGALWLQRDLDALSLGDDVAASLGVVPHRVQRRVTVVVALLVGTATAVAGVLGFIGLVVPHVTRRLLGFQARHVIPLSALVGATFFLLVDTGTRFAPMPLPPGVITSLVGAPFFLWLLLRRNGGSQP